MTRRKLLFAAAAPRSKPQDIIIVLCDDLGYGDHGFAHCFSAQNNADASHENPINFVRSGEPAGPLKRYSSQAIVNEALTWMKSVPTAKPIGLFLYFHSPHEPVATSPACVTATRARGRRATRWCSSPATAARRR